jgi:hypothetical protein
MNVNQWFSIAKKKDVNWYKSTIPDCMRPSLNLKFSLSHEWTCLSIDGTRFCVSFVNAHTVATQTEKKKNEMTFFFEKDVEKWKTATGGHIMLSFISGPHGPKVSLFSFFVSRVCCYDKIYRQFVSLDLKVKEKKKITLASRRSP